MGGCKCKVERKRLTQKCVWGGGGSEGRKDDRCRGFRKYFSHVQVSFYGLIKTMQWILCKKPIKGTLGWARFASNFFSLISEIKRIWIRFTCVSLFHYKISLLFFRFFSLIFASNFSLHFTWVIFASKRNKAKRNSSLFFRFFHFFSLFFAFFCFFCFFSRFSALNDSLHFEGKQSKAKFKSIFRFFRFFPHFFSLFSLFFAFFRFFSLFSA